MNLEVSEKFRAEVVKTILALFLFLAVYVALIIAAIGLMALCLLAAIGIIRLYAHVMAFVIAAGFISLGCFILFFLFKFLFKKSAKADESHLLEVTAAQEPELFALIENLVEAVGTRRPNKVFLSPGVNASVFYESTFSSMFLPIRKNLQIGLGLVNSATEREFKAVLAHEFGHFSQKSMRAGSYVYNMNRIIFDMLYDNNTLGNAMQGWAEAGQIFYFFAKIAEKMIEGIQWVLQKMYGFVNTRYMALSRQMEFHADAIAAHITGHKPLQTALLRLDLADQCLNEVFHFYNGRIAMHQKSTNIYREQTFVMHFLSAKNGIPLKDGFPTPVPGDAARYNPSKLNIEDQWASHPSLEDRIEALEKLNIPAEPSPNRPARDLFSQIMYWEERFTQQVFASVHFTETPTEIPLPQFEVEFTRIVQQNSFSSFYNGYYNDWNPSRFTVTELESDADPASIGSLFSNEKISMVYEYHTLERDQQMVQHIADESLKIKTFDYEGYKYHWTQGWDVVSKIYAEREALGTQIAENDRKIFTIFYKAAQRAGKVAELLEQYNCVEALNQDLGRRLQVHSALSDATRFMHENTSHEMIEIKLAEMLSIETEFKQEIGQLLAAPALSSAIPAPTRENFDLYCSKQWLYFSVDRYFDDEVAVLFMAMSDYFTLLSEGHHRSKKALLDFQEELLATL